MGHTEKTKQNKKPGHKSRCFHTGCEGSRNDLIHKWCESYAVACTFTRAQSNWTPSLECQITKTLFHMTFLSAFIHHPLFDSTYAAKQTIKNQAHGFPFWWVRRANILLADVCYCGFLYSTAIFSRTLRWMKEGQRDVGWRVTTRVQPSTNFNIQPSPSFPAINSPIEWEKEREYNRWEAAQKYLTCSRMRATVCVCVCVQRGSGEKAASWQDIWDTVPSSVS